jgi:glycosyltransferase involved in cell wall biosynthesis
MKIAYLVNRYPAVSHSFIRREILALEALGASVERHSIRRPDADLPDAGDRAERARTFLVLDQGYTALIWSLLLVAVQRPGRWLGAARTAVAMAEPSPKSMLRHAAYLVEACLLARRFERLGIVHVHAHFGTNPTAVARLVERLTGIGYSFTAHGPDEFDSPLGYDLAGKIAGARFAVGVSSFGRSQLMRWSDHRHWSRIKAVRCSVGEDYLAGSPPAGNVSNVLSCVARLSPQKGLPLLIDAAGILDRRGIDFHLRLVGDGPMRAEIEAQVERLGLERKVTITGWCDGPAVRRHLLESRAMVMASFAEGLPVVIMEALALGRPVIATAIAGIPELVDDRCGWLVSAGSIEALADAMAAALEATAETLARMGETGRARVADCHSAATNGRLLLNLIEEAVANGSGRA